MLLEDFNDEKRVMVDYVINQCKKYGCMKSLKMFVNGHCMFMRPDKPINDFGVYNTKKMMKSKNLPLVIHKESDSVFKKNHNHPYMSEGTMVFNQKTNGLHGECIALIPDDSSVVPCQSLSAIFNKKNKQLITRLNKHLKNKTEMDEFSVGECIARIDLSSNTCITKTEKDFSQVYSKIVEEFPDCHSVIMQYYLKPLKAFMEDYIKQCPNGGVELFEEHYQGLVDCPSMVYINMKDLESVMDLDEFRGKLKERMIY